MVKGISPDVAGEILSALGSEENFFRLTESDLQSIAMVSSRVFSAAYRNGLIEKAKREYDYLSGKGISACYFTDSNYPARFLTAADSPLLLYYIGNCDLNAKKIISIVGTRHASAYGMALCHDTVLSLKEKVGNDVVVVSGLAYGVDVSAHTAALEAGLPTVAVMAHGLDMIYPSQHRAIAAEIAKRGGAIVTEYASGTRIHRSNFLARNRIIAALSDCTLVVESATKGGALVTANIASGYGRDVFAFPGRVGDEYSAGCNSLIKKNIASLVSGVDDIADSMQWERKAPVAVQQELFLDLDSDEQRIYDCLAGSDMVHISELVGALKISVHSLLSSLVEMEFKGLIHALPGNRYCLLRKL